MIDKDKLETLLVAWAREYGPGGLRGIGWSDKNLLATLIEHEGFVPGSGGHRSVVPRTAADDVEDAVKAMRSGGWARQASVLQCDYFNPGTAMPDRLARLRRVGVDVAQARYYTLLEQAKAFVSGSLYRLAEQARENRSQCA